MLLHLLHAISAKHQGVETRQDLGEVVEVGKAVGARVRRRHQHLQLEVNAPENDHDTERTKTKHISQPVQAIVATTKLKNKEFNE